MSQVATFGLCLSLLVAIVISVIAVRYRVRQTKTAERAVGETLSRYFQTNKRRQIHKWLHYFEIYEKHFQRFRNTDVVVVEIGVSHGGSLQMWKEYFGPKARIIGIDIDERCKALEEPQIEVHIGDQSDRAFWARFKAAIPRVDVVIDDGGHTMQQQNTTFEELYPYISAHGVYMCEDTHSSYKEKRGGGYRRAGTFVERSKELIDQLTAWHSCGPSEFKVDDFTRSTNSISFYDSVIVFEKQPRQPPSAARTGRRSL